MSRIVPGRPFATALLLAVLVAGSSAAAVPLPDAEAPADLDLPGDAAVHCASPPCGYIWPRLGLAVDVASPYPSARLADFPTTIQVDLTYSWDLEQEGTGLSDLTTDMQITVVVTRTPAWLSAELDQHVCSFTLLPVNPEGMGDDSGATSYEVCTLTVTTKLRPEQFPTTEEELRESGHRLMLFAASEESGTFMKSYGLADIRFRWDEPPVQDDAPMRPDGTVPTRSEDPDASEAPALAPLVVFVTLAGLVAVLRRRR